MHDAAQESRGMNLKKNQMQLMRLLNRLPLMLYGLPQLSRDDFSCSRTDQTFRCWEST